MKSEKGNSIRQGTISDGGCTENCIKLRIIPLDFEMLDSSYPITKRDSETDNVMNLRSTITTKLSNPVEHPQMLSIRSQTYP